MLRHDYTLEDVYTACTAGKGECIEGRESGPGWQGGREKEEERKSADSGEGGMICKRRQTSQVTSRWAAGVCEVKPGRAGKLVCSRQQGGEK